LRRALPKCKGWRGKPQFILPACQMSLARLGLLRRTGFLARRPLGILRLRAGPEYKFEFPQGKYHNDLDEDEDLNSDWVYPDQDEGYLHGPISPQKWMAIISGIAVGCYAFAKFLMFMAPENPAAPRTFEGHLWEEHGGDPANPPTDQADVRRWLYVGLEGRRRYKEEDIMVEHMRK